MKKYACQYAIVRFMPFAETGEFANIGVVMICPEIQFFDFKLLASARTKRITEFFEQLKAGVYRKARIEFEQELKRIQGFVNDRNNPAIITPSLLINLFGELVRPREVMIHFDLARAVLAVDPILKLEELFAFYVERSFCTPVYQEALIEKNVRNVLKNAHLLEKYKKGTLGNKDAYRAAFPFVYFENGIARKVIKPLNLSQDDPVAIYDHGWAWLGKIKKLRDLKLLSDEVLFAVKKPGQLETSELEMFNEIVETFQENHIKVASEDDQDAILAFAK